jgi:lysophospholipase L1-like esterase
VPGWESYVAIGDSFTEGLNDPDPDGGFRGWADRLAERLAEQAAGFRYANLAVRGRLLRGVVDEQVPLAVELRPDLVTFAAGGNDILRPGGDPDTMAEVFERAVVRLREAGSDVLIFTGFDPRGTPLLQRVRGKIATYNGHLRAISDRHGCQVIDLWSMAALHHPRAWSADRLHLSADGHERVALRVADVLGLPGAAGWNATWPPAPRQPWVAMRREDLRWARQHLAPWLGRRLLGRSSGDDLQPKRPRLLPL